METYVSSLLDAIEAVRAITGSEDVNLHAACSGAITTSALLGYLAAKKQKLIHAVSMMVAVLRPENESLLGAFASKGTIAAARLASEAKGVLEGEEMSRIFAWMRPNDLVWNYWVNNYLMGNPLPAFDVLYWNSDSTRLPAGFHSDLLDVLGGESLHKPGVMSVLGGIDRPEHGRCGQVRCCRGDRPHHAVEGRVAVHRPVRRIDRVRAEQQWAHPKPDQPAGQSAREILSWRQPDRSRR
jgi:poly(3-hydroxyalkanoate) synthetase